MLVDHERAWHQLKERLRGRQGVGIGSLFALMAELEVECQVEEGVPERALRLYGVALQRGLITSGIQPAPASPQAAARDGEGTALPRAGDGSKEEQDGSRNEAAAGVV